MRRPSLPCQLALLLALLSLGGRALGEEDAAEHRRRVAQAQKEALEAQRVRIESVNRAIDKGVKWLQGAQSGQGTWLNPAHPTSKQNLGRQALTVYCLLKCGVSAKDKGVQEGLSALGPLIKQHGDPPRTYSVAVQLLLEDALANPTERKAKGKPKPCKYPKGSAVQIAGWVDFLVKNQAANVWRYPGAIGETEDQDLSNTMYALFALGTADRCGVEVPEEVWRKALDYLIEWQQETGPEVPLWVPNPAYEPGGEDRYGPFLPGRKTQARGWSYLPRRTNAVTGSMTTAGLFCLGVIRERLAAREALDPATRKRIDGALHDGMAWMGKHFAVTKNPGQGGWHYYYLYGLERAGAVLGLESFGQHYWYTEGADYLVQQQQGDGAWPVPTESIVQEFEDPVLQTVFALLFLKRASAPPIPIGPVITGE